MQQCNVFYQGWYAQALQLHSPFFNQRPNVSIDTLVIHNISLPSGEFGNNNVRDLFLGCLNCQAHASFSDLQGVEVSAHFFIARTGVITQFVSTEDRAWHAGISEFHGVKNVNDFSIGIELEGTDTIEYTEAQYDVLQSLTVVLMQHYPITYDRIVGHNEIAPERKTDPGQSFDWQRYINSLRT